MIDKRRAWLGVIVLIVFGTIPARQDVPSAQTRSGPAAAGEFRIQTLSNRPDMLSGGDALVRVDVPAGVALRDVRVTLENRDVTAMFRADAAAHAVAGLVSGLRNGPNMLAVTAAPAEGGAAARLVLTNYPVAGPIFSGPHEQPFTCETQNFTLRSGGTLGPPLDDTCSIATRVDYVYRSTSGGALKPLADPKRSPDDLAQVTTSLGRTVPYVVRIETGTINRAIYQIAVLHDPAREPEPDFLTPPGAWNRRLIYTFGGGCNGGWYRQAITTGGVEDDLMLRNGYAVASATLTVAGNNCNQVLSAETMMMVKERFIEAFGLPAFTIGYGASGGAYQQHVIADAYPGLLDGIMPLLSFPDVMHALTTTSADSWLLDHYFTRTAIPYTDEQKRAISGYVSVANMLEASRVRAPRISPTATCPEVLSSSLRYDAVNNPKGARCDIYDHAVNILGRDAQTGFARRPLDNVGIQYGLAALNAGSITTTQFLDLNERIGGFDIDANIIPQRNVADLDALRVLYRSGLLTSGRAGLSTIPIIDHRAYLDEAPKGDPHLRYHSFSMRARLMKANGHADNHVILVDPAERRAATSSPAFQEALSHMDQWLTTLSQDVSSDAAIVKLRRARPAGLVDACWTRDASYRKIAEPQVYGSGECERLYPSASYPRGVAGESIAADIVKCQLKTIDPRDYTVPFTSDEKARRETIFSGGVCDWSKPGVGQEAAVQTWQRYDTPRPVSSR